MKLHLAGASGLNSFNGYGAGFVIVNGTRYERSVVVLPDRIIPDWPPASFDALAPADFAPLAALPLEIVLLGTGTSIRFPRPEVVRPLIEAHIGVEVMDAPAACRTYNILVGEARKVAAALILP